MIAKVFKAISIGLLVLVIALAAVLLWLWPLSPYVEMQPFQFELQRSEANPIIHTGMSPRLARIGNSGVSVRE